MRRSRLHLGKLTALLAIVALIVAACGGGDPTATPRPTVTPPPAATATPVPQPTATPVPTVAAGPQQGGVLRLPLLQDLSHLDLAKGSFFHNNAFAANVYSNILRFNWEPPRSDVLPDLAESWEFNSDGTQLTLRFRQGVKWHDGESFTADDAKFSLEKNAGRFAPQLKIIESMELPDPLTLVINMTRAQASFPSLLSHYRLAIFARHVWDAAEGDLSNGPSVGTGGFVLDEFDRGVAYTVVRNANYFLPGIPYLDGVKAFVVKDEGTRLALFRAGRLDILGPSATPVNQEQIADLRSSVSDLQPIGFNALNTAVIVVNSDKAPWDNVNVRKALFLSIDRWEMAQLPHIEKPSGPLVGPPGWGLSDEELFKLPGYGKGADYDRDLAEAKRLLAEAGFPNGLDVEFIGSPTSYHVTSLEVLVDHLARAGIRTTGGPVPSAEDVARRNEGTFEINMQGVGLSFPDPDGAVLSVERGLFVKLEDARILELWAQQGVAKDLATRQQIIRDMQLRMLEVVNIVPIGWSEFFHVAQPNVRDYHTPLGYTDFNMDHVWMV